MTDTFVGSTYDRIASHFSKTREYAWPEVTEFLDEYGDHLATDRTGTGSESIIGLDIGCGNGRHLEPLSRTVDDAIGVDLSRKLLAVARKRGLDRGFDSNSSLVRGDAASLPVTTQTIDIGIYVATIHHLSPRSRRRRSLNELARVLRADGVGLVSAWSTVHDRFDRETGFDTTIDWSLPDGETVPRFYHIYDPDEFVADIEASALFLDSLELSSGNCYGVVRPEE